MDHWGVAWQIAPMSILGTRIATLLRGREVGRDADGRRYFEDRRGRAEGVAPHLHVRRWVLYKGAEDPSAVPPEWWAWLHYAAAAPLPETARRPWQLPYEPNMTGTPAGYRPPGSEYRGGVRPRATGDYESWSPDA